MITNGSRWCVVPEISYTTIKKNNIESPKMTFNKYTEYVVYDFFNDIDMKK